MLYCSCSRVNSFFIRNPAVVQSAFLRKAMLHMRNGKMKCTYGGRHTTKYLP
jgi:hypothetical protein